MTHKKTILLNFFVLKTVKYNVYYTYTADNKIKTPQELDDEEWMIALKCLDDVHSNKNELTIQAVEALIRKVEGQIGSIRPQLCGSEAVSKGLR